MKPIYRDILSAPDASFVINEYQMSYFDIPWHLHPQYEIIYVVRSTGTRYVGDSIEPFREDDLVLLGNGLPHCWLNAPINECEGKNFEVHYIVIQFNPDFLGMELLEKPEFQKLNDFLQQSARGIHFSGDIILTIKKQLMKLLHLQDLEKMILFFDILNNLMKCNDRRYLSSHGFIARLSDEKQPVMKKVMAFIFENFKHSITLEQVADIAGMTPTSFCRSFKKHYKKSLFSFVKEFRIGYARRLLRETRLSIHEICFESGYDNLTCFYRQFKEITKTTPKRFRKQ